MASQIPEFDTVMSMQGVGESTGPQLMTEIGDIRRFAGKQSIVAFAGVNPMPNQFRSSLTEADGCEIRSLCLLRSERIWERSFLEVEACCLYADCISYTEGEGSPCSLKNYLLPFSASATAVTSPTKPLRNSAISAQDISVPSSAAKRLRQSILWKSSALHSTGRPTNCWVSPLPMKNSLTASLRRFVTTDINHPTIVSARLFRSALVAIAIWSVNINLSVIAVGRSSVGITFAMPH